MSTQLPLELKAALEPYAAVRAIIENLPQHHLEAYLCWVLEPLRPELRQQRIAQTIHRLLEAAA
jgi:uncharacterized protein YdeI (YjbR/CyaY-like superfamily)